MKERIRMEMRNDTDIIADTVGHLVSVPDKAARLQWGSMFKRIPAEMLEYVHKHFGKEHWNDSLQINFNHSPMWEQMKRLFQKDRRTNLFVRSTLGVVTTAATSLWSKLTRRDVYNPFSNSAQVFHTEKAMVMKQVAMAHNYDTSKIPTIRAIGSLGGVLPAAGLNILNPITAMPDSWMASKAALAHMPEGDRKLANKALEPDFVFDTFGGKWLVLPALFLGALAYKQFRSGEKSIFFGNKPIVGEASVIPKNVISRSELALAA